MVRHFGISIGLLLLGLLAFLCLFQGERFIESLGGAPPTRLSTLLNAAMFFGLWIAGGAFVGAAIFNLFCHPVIGAILGGFIQLGLPLFVLGQPHIIG